MLLSYGTVSTILHWYFNTVGVLSPSLAEACASFCRSKEPALEHFGVVRDGLKLPRQAACTKPPFSVAAREKW